MKKRIFTVATIVLPLIICSTISCKTNTLQKENPQKEYDKYEEVAILHNEGLEYVFEEFKTQAQKGKLDLSPTNIIKTSATFMKTKGIVASVDVELYYMPKLNKNIYKGSVYHKTI